MDYDRAVPYFEPAAEKLPPSDPVEAKPEATRAAPSFTAKVMASPKATAMAELKLEPETLPNGDISLQESRSRTIYCCHSAVLPCK